MVSNVMTSSKCTKKRFENVAKWSAILLKPLLPEQNVDRILKMEQVFNGFWMRRYGVPQRGEKWRLRRFHNDFNTTQLCMTHSDFTETEHGKNRLLGVWKGKHEKNN